MSLLQIYQWVCQWKNLWKSFNIWGSYGQEFSVLFFLRHVVFTAVCWYHTCRGGYATSECCRLLTTVHSKVPWVVSSSRSSRWMQKITPRPFLAGILTLKQCYRVHMNTPFSFRKLKKFPSAPVAPRTTCTRRSTFARPPLHNPRYATVHIPPAWCILSIINIAMIAETDQSMFVRRAPLIRSWKSGHFEFRPNC